MSDTHTYFITGTDTEVGKTRVAAGLLFCAEQRGMATAAAKPVAAGCDDNGLNEDALLLQAAMSEVATYEQVNPFALQAAIAPHIAAEEEGRALEVSALSEYCRSVMSGPADFVVVEGAGGWRVPLNDSETFADLAVALQAPVILVVAMRLGCINHALLTAEAVRRDGLTLAGWVANIPGEKMARHEQNMDTLKRLMEAPLLGEVPFLEGPSHGVLSDYLNLDALL